MDNPEHCQLWTHEIEIAFIGSQLKDWKVKQFNNLSEQVTQKSGAGRPKVRYRQTKSPQHDTDIQHRLGLLERDRPQIYLLLFRKCKFQPQLYLILHVSAKTLTIERIIPSWNIVHQLRYQPNDSNENVDIQVSACDALLEYLSSGTLIVERL